MFRKTTSNNMPRPSLTGEIKKEFGVYFSRADQKGRQLMAKYPRQLFALMVVSILFSGVLAFTVMRSPKPKLIPPATGYPQQAVSGIGQIMNTANALQAVWAMQAQVNGLLKKDRLTVADSLVLKHALEKIDSIQKALHGLPQKAR